MRHAKKCFSMSIRYDRLFDMIRRMLHGDIVHITVSRAAISVLRGLSLLSLCKPCDCDTMPQQIACDIYQLLSADC